MPLEYLVTSIMIVQNLLQTYTHSPSSLCNSPQDAGGQGVGFLLGSLNVSVALTSEACYKGLPKTQAGEVITFKGWPKLHWFVTEHLSKAPKDWLPPQRQSEDSPAYIEVSGGMFL